MQRRGVHHHASTNNDNVENDSLSLPAASGSDTATATATTPNTRNQRKRRPKKGDSSAAGRWAFDPLMGLFVMFILAGVVLLIIRLIGGGGNKAKLDQKNLHDEAQRHRRLLPPMYGFPSLQYPLHHSQLVGLYFAASWCSMSTPVTRMLEEHFGTLLLAPPPRLEGEKENHKPPLQRRGLSIVYISSDKTEEEMKQYVKSNWFEVPFDSEEKSNLKRHFSVCARVELSELKMERKFEIPTLILLDGETQGVLTTNGVQDLYERGAHAMDYWLDLLHKMKDFDMQ